MASHQYPGQYVDDVVLGATGAVRGLVSSLAGGVRQAGESVQRALEVPTDAIGIKSGPGRIVHDPVNGLVGAAENFVNVGVVHSIEMVVQGVTDGLDRIPDTLMNSRIKMGRR
jgi:hypothetical protein